MAGWRARRLHDRQPLASVSPRGPCGCAPSATAPCCFAARATRARWAAASRGAATVAAAALALYRMRSVHAWVRRFCDESYLCRRGMSIRIGIETHIGHSQSSQSGAARSELGRMYATEVALIDGPNIELVGGGKAERALPPAHEGLAAPLGGPQLLVGAHGGA